MIIDEVLSGQIQLDESGKVKSEDIDGKPSVQPSEYQPDDETKRVTAMILDSFRWGDVTMRKPRREFNDMSVLSRMMVDQMAFNIYQPNNGQPYPGDVSNSWKSNAVRPIIRNKVMSIAAHATARMLFPKIHAYNEQSELQQDAATAMRDLIEWAAEQNDYAKHTMYAVINALVNPVSIIHVEYAEAYRTIKTEKDENGKWKEEEILDEDRSGFKISQVPVDEFYIANFYEEDIQKQEWVIWRRVLNYGDVQAKYGKEKNFKYVRPGYQILYNDANTTFYEVYDSNLRGSLCEEVIFYSKPLDLQISIVNGVMMSDPDNPNPRKDKNYPFVTFGYENMDEGRCFYKKSLAFKVQPDADIINNLYPMIIDGTYLSIMPPLIIAGEEEIAADVIVPGTTTTLSNPETTVTPLRVAQDIRQGMETLFKVEESINQSSQDPTQSGNKQAGTTTAYEISKIEQNAQTVLGLFTKMIASYVKQTGKLLVSDILQYLTIPEVDKIIDDGDLIYKTFIVHDRQSEGGIKNRRIKFDLNLPESVSDEEELNMSYDILEEQGGEGDQELYKVNPSMFRNFKYMCFVSPDVITPMSDDLERAFGLELFDRAIQGPALGVDVDMEQVFKDFLFSLYPKAKNDVNKYFKEQQLTPPVDPNNPNQVPGQQPQVQQIQPQQNPMANPMAKPQASPMATMLNNPLVNK